MVLKILAGLTVLGVLVGAFGIWVLSGAPMPGFAPRRTPPPEGFEASAFPTLETVASTDTAAVLNLAEFGAPFDFYHLPDLGVTYVILFDGDVQRTLYLNAAGALIGEIADRPIIYPLGHFMVLPDAYYEITQGGVSDRQKIRRLTGVTPGQLDAMIAQSQHYRTYSGTDLAEGDPARAAGLVAHVLFHDEVWKRVDLPPSDYRKWVGVDFHDLDAVYQVTREDDGPHFGGRYRVELTYFDQQEYLPSRGAPMGSTTGMGRQAQWTGTGFYTVYWDAVPILRFRIEDDRERLSPGSSQLSVHGGAALDFVLIERVDITNHRQMIVVSYRTHK